MQNNQEMPKLNVDLANTQPYIDQDGGQLFMEGMILRKVSKFLTGSSEDQLVPIPVVINIRTKKVVTELLPPQLKEEFEEYNKNLD